MPTPDILFLGFCSRAEMDNDKTRWNVIGLSNHITTHIIPSYLPPLLAITVNFENIDEFIPLHILDEQGLAVGEINIQGELVEAETAVLSDETQPNSLSFRRGQAWTTLFVPYGPPGILITKPGLYSVVQLKDDKKLHIGGFQFEYVQVPPLTPERLEAIKSDPNASKSVRIKLACKQCSSDYRAYFGIQRNQKMENQGWLWAPDMVEPTFHCSCGATTIELSYLRSGLESLLGRSTAEIGKYSSENELGLTPLYERSLLEKIRRNFLTLLNKNPPEEQIQRYITNNPILLHMFSAVKLISKPPISVKFNADFAILNARGDLLLVEIERANIKLLKKNGHRAQELIHAFDQVGDWLIKIDEHRVSVLDDLKIKAEDVHNIRGVVIAGRERGYDASHIRTLKMRSNDALIFMTYDDVLGAMDTLIQSIKRS